MTPGIDRRRFLTGAAAGSAALVLRPRRPAAAADGPFDLGDGVTIQPRSAWAGALAPTGPLVPEPDVQVLLVHHSVDGNEYAVEEVPTLLQGIYHLHTGPEKGWPDVAYNFFVDRHGGVWEGRQGSLRSAVAGDATGGNQGSSQLCCFLGDHSTEPPTPDAVTAMTHLLAWLGEREDIDTSPGATTSFTSRGSNLWPAGTTVTATTIAGHREMSATACPGDAAFELVKGQFPDQVTAVRLSRAVRSAPSSTTTTASATATSTTGAPATTTTAPADSAAAESAAAASSSGDAGLLAKGLVAGGVVGLVTAAAVWGRARLLQRPRPPRP